VIGVLQEPLSFTQMLVCIQTHRAHGALLPAKAWRGQWCLDAATGVSIARQQTCGDIASR
jgi:hypothetical protein